MPELTFDEMAIARALSNAVEYSAAHRLGEAIAQGIATKLAESAVPNPSRDQLAAMAMQGLSSVGVALIPSPAAVLARVAYDIADAMLAESKRGRTP